MVHQYCLWVEPRIDHHRLAVPALRTRDWTNGLVVVSAATIADVCGDRWWVVRVGRNAASPKQTMFAHGTCVPCNTCLVFLLGTLLLPPSPQEEEDATHDCCDGSDTSNNTSHNSASVVGATAGRRCLLGGFGRLIDDRTCNDGTALRDDLHTSGRRGGRRVDNRLKSRGRFVIRGGLQMR